MNKIKAKIKALIVNIKREWNEDRARIKNTIMFYLLLMTGISLLLVHSMEKIIGFNNLEEYFYGPNWQKFVKKK